MTLEETIAHHRWCADICEGEVRDEQLQMVAWLEELERLKRENAKLRELAHLVAEYTSADQCEGCVAKRACNAGELDMCLIRKAILEKLRELGVGVK